MDGERSPGSRAVELVYAFPLVAGPDHSKKPAGDGTGNRPLDGRRYAVASGGFGSIGISLLLSDRRKRTKGSASGGTLPSATMI